MARPFKSVWLFLLGLLGMHGGSALAANGVLCIDGVKGESTRIGGCIDVQSWSWGASNSGGISPKNNFQEFHWVEASDSSSDDLFTLLVTHPATKGAQYSEYKDDCGAGCSPTPYLTMHFGNVAISSFSNGNSSGAGEVASLQLSMTFGAISYCYSPTVSGVLGTPQCSAYSLTDGGISPF